MNDAWQILTSMGASGLLVAVVNNALGRKKMTAEATEIITNAAGSMTDRLERQVQTLQDRADRHDREDLKRDRTLATHSKWDRLLAEEMRRAFPDREFPEPPSLYPPDGPEGEDPDQYAKITGGD